MKRPRGVSGKELAQKLKPFGYRVTRQVGSHMRLTTEQSGQHHITVPAHHHLAIGKINAVLWELTRHFGISRQGLMEKLFG